MTIRQALRRRTLPTDLRAVGSGLIALDVILDEASSPVMAAVGGSTGNVLAALAYLGWNSVPVCELGRDIAGGQVRAEFERLKADLRFVIENDHSCTPVVYQMPTDSPETHSFSFRCPHCGQRRGFSAPANIRLGEEVLEGVPKPSVFYFDRITPVSLTLAETYHASGVLVVFEPSAMPSEPEEFQRAISATHILKYADNRFAEFPYDVSNVALEIKTRGAHGLEFRLPSLLGTWTPLPAIRVPTIADTAGAGDWCTAGMLAALFEAGLESSWQLTYNAAHRALRYGQSLAALNCMHIGARGVTQRWSARHLKHLAMELLKKSGTSIHPIHKQSKKPSKKIKAPQQLCCEPLAV